MTSIPPPSLAAAVVRGIEDACALPPGSVKPEGHLAGYGLDSARALELLARLEDEFGVVVDDADLADVRTVAALVAAVERAAARTGGAR